MKEKRLINKIISEQNLRFLFRRKIVPEQSSGFTLAEILVVIAILAIAGTMLVAIFSGTLRGSNKSQVLSAIKQNGQAVLDIIDKTIRSSDNVVCLNPESNPRNLVVVKNGVYTRFRLKPPSPGLNGVIQEDIQVQPQSGDIQLFITALCSEITAMVSPVDLTDSNPQSGVSADFAGSLPVFAKSIQPGFKTSVTVSFTLGPGVNVPEVIRGQIDPVVFQTTIQLR